MSRCLAKTAVAIPTEGLRARCPASVPQQTNEAEQRHPSPHTVCEDEAELPDVQRDGGQSGGADEVESEVRNPERIQAFELKTAETQDHERTSNQLNGLGRHLGSIAPQRNRAANSSEEAR